MTVSFELPVPLPRLEINKSQGPGAGREQRSAAVCQFGNSLSRALLSALHRRPGCVGDVRAARPYLRVSRLLIWINEPTKVFIARRGVHELTTTILTGDEVRDLPREDAEVLRPRGSIFRPTL